MTIARSRAPDQLSSRIGQHAARSDSPSAIHLTVGVIVERIVGSALRGPNLLSRAAMPTESALVTKMRLFPDYSVMAHMLHQLAVKMKTIEAYAEVLEGQDRRLCPLASAQ
jgi:hypothetical protein